MGRVITGLSRDHCHILGALRYEHGVTHPLDELLWA